MNTTRPPLAWIDVLGFYGIGIFFLGVIREGLEERVLV